MAIDVPVVLENFVSFGLASLLIELTPGPNMTYLAIVSAAEGRRVGFAAVAGVALGLGIVGLLAAFGLTEAIQASSVLYEGLRWAGVIFLLYLAWDGWRAGADVVSAGVATHGKHYDNRHKPCQSALCEMTARVRTCASASARNSRWQLSAYYPQKPD